MDVDSRAGFPYGAAEIFSLMQQMGCEPDRASYNIMLDAYGRAGLHKGTLFESAMSVYYYNILNRFGYSVFGLIFFFCQN